jgi:hypothetical protein
MYIATTVTVDETAGMEEDIITERMDQDPEKGRC